MALAPLKLGHIDIVIGYAIGTKHVASAAAVLSFSQSTLPIARNHEIIESISILNS